MAKLRTTTDSFMFTDPGASAHRYGQHAGMMGPAFSRHDAWHVLPPRPTEVTPLESLITHCWLVWPWVIGLLAVLWVALFAAQSLAQVNTALQQALVVAGAVS